MGWKQISVLCKWWLLPLWQEWKGLPSTEFIINSKGYKALFRLTLILKLDPTISRCFRCGFLIRQNKYVPFKNQSIFIINIIIKNYFKEKNPIAKTLFLILPWTASLCKTLKWGNLFCQQQRSFFFKTPNFMDSTPTGSGWFYLIELHRQQWN